jgi:hypothetical protein
MNSIWKKDLSPSVMPWLGPILGVLFVFGGLRAIVTQQLKYRAWAYHGAPAVIGGIQMLLFSYFMFRGVIWKRRPWSKLDILVGATAILITLGFAASQWFDILR